MARKIWDTERKLHEMETAEISPTLEEKFETVRHGRGIAFAVPLSSIIGVNLYQFMSNNRIGRGQ